MKNMFRVFGRVGAASLLLALGLNLSSVTSSDAATGELYAAGYFSAGIFDSAPGFTDGTFIADYAGISAPRGGLVLGSNFWISDNAYNFTKLTFDPAIGIAEPHTPPPANVFDVLLNLAKPGQPAFDAARSVIYMPSAQTKTGGVYRSFYTAGLDTGSFSLPVQLAPGAGLDGPRPNAVALGPDGQLYVGFQSTGDIRRINNPAGITQTVQTIGKSSKGGQVYGLAFVGNDLYLAEKNGFSVIHNATACNSGCSATLMPHSIVGQSHLGIATDGVDTIYVATNNSIMRYTLSTQSQVLFANSGALPDRTIVPFMMAGQMTATVLDAAGNLWVSDDTSGGVDRFHGRLWVIPAGSGPVQ